MMSVSAKAAMGKKISQDVLRYHGRKISPQRYISDLINNKSSVTQPGARQAQVCEEG